MYALLTILLILFSAEARAQEPAPSPADTAKLAMAAFMLGPSSLTDSETDFKFSGTHIVLTGLDFYRVTEMNLVLGYHFGEKSSGSVQRKLYMPEMSLNLDINAMALPTIRQAMPELFSLALYGGGGAGLSYLPFGDRAIVTSGGVESDSTEWHWDHLGWNVHLLGGFVLDKQLGGVVGLYFVNPILGEQQFKLTDVRMGLLYRLQ